MLALHMKERFMSTAPVSRSFPSDGFPAEIDSHLPSNAIAMESRVPQAQALVLSRNPEVVEVVRNAARTVTRVVHARDLDDAIRSLPHIEPAVVLIDGAITGELGTIIAQSMRRFPDSMIVAVGTREEANELMQLAAAGRIFRFLLMPLSYGPVRLTLAAAVSQHIERKAAARSIANVPAESSASRRRHALAYAAVATLLFTIIGVLWQVSGFLAAKAPAASAASAAAPTRVRGVAARDTARSQLVMASKAMGEGRYLEPAGNNALDLYRSVLRADPSNVTARTGVRTVADEVLQRAEQALVEERLEDAERNVLLARQIDADHPRLAFYDKSLARQRELSSLNQRRDAANRVRQLVNEARSEIRAGNLIGTAAGGAVGALTEARRLDPMDPAVLQSVRELNVALADAVRMAVTAGDTPRAQGFFNAARRLGAADQDQLWATIERSLKEAKRNPVPPVVNPVPAPTPPVIEPVPEQAVRGSDSAAPSSTAAEVPLKAGELKRLKQVLPNYPIAAAADGIEGYVDLEFTISTDGVPRNMTVVGATPRRVFDAAAMNCVRQWRFEPIKQNGLPVSRRAALRVRFQLK
jgi:TonB family protein